MIINEHELHEIAYIRRNGPMWRSSVHGRSVLITLHTDGDYERYHEQWQRWAQLSHPHIVPLVDVIAHTDGRWAIVQEEIQGQTLAMHCQTRSELVRLHGDELMKQIRAGVCALHEGGIVHGDLSPRNIMVTADAQAVIIDLIESADEYATDVSFAVDDAALDEIAAMIHSTMDSEPQQIASQPHDPGARLRAQAQLPATELLPRKRSWRNFGRAAKNVPSEPYSDEQASGDGGETARATIVTSGKKRRLRTLALAVASVSAICALSGWGTIQLWNTRAYDDAFDTATGISVSERTTQSPHTMPLPCPDEQQLRERLTQILAARDTAYAQQATVGLERYAGQAVIDADRAVIDSMKERGISVRRFHTIIDTLTDIHCDETKIQASAILHVETYELCTTHGCEEAAPTLTTPQPLVLTFDMKTQILDSANTQADGSE